MLRARLSRCVAALLQQHGDGLFKQLGHQDVLVADDALGVDEVEIDTAVPGRLDRSRLSVRVLVPPEPGR